LDEHLLSPDLLVWAFLKQHLPARHYPGRTARAPVIATREVVRVVAISGQLEKPRFIIDF
jgi:hypothetical protein